MTTPSDTQFFGHPRGLATLFFTELWERFSYYGLRALLILFMTAAASEGGLGFDVASAGAVYGLFTATVYLLSLPGGWIADRIIGQRRAVLYGGILIALGNLILVVHSVPIFFLGLVVITIGTGLLKPNVSTIVGQLYRQGDSRRDAAFSIFYMGINLGAFLAPLDNIMWQRKLIADLFDFEYTWEVYKPQHLRQYGYYVLPILYGDRLVGRIDPALQRKSHTLQIKGLWWEEDVQPDTAMLKAVHDCLEEFMGFLGARDLTVEGGFANDPLFTQFG